MGFLHSVAESPFAPALLFAIAFGFATLLSKRIPIRWTLLSTVCIAVVSGCALAYLALPVLFEDAETNIAAVSALAMRGGSIYPSMAAPERYALLYGPLTYLLHDPFFAVFGLSLFGFKIAGVFALGVSDLAIYRTLRAYAPAPQAWIGLGAVNLVFFRFLHVEFWGRNDPLLVCLVAVALWVLVRTSDTCAVSIGAMAVAGIANLKISGLAYCLPIVVFAWVHRGFKIAALTTLLAAALFPLPFTLHQVSWTNYAAVLEVAGRHGLNAGFLARNLQYSAVILLPALVLSRRIRPTAAQTSYLLSICAAFLAASISGAKNGAGSYHLLPLIAPVVHFCFWLLRGAAETSRATEFTRVAVACALALVFYSANFVSAVARTYGWSTRGRAALQEIAQLQQRFAPETLAIGPGDDFRDPRTFYAYEPVFHGQPYLVSGAAVRDLQFGGVPIPESTVQMLQRCDTRVWLIPRGEIPFSAPNTYYETSHPAFDQNFRDSFFANYRLAESHAEYDVWTCKQPSE